MCHLDRQPDWMDDRPDNKTFSGEEEEQPNEIETLSLQEQKTQAFDNMLAVANLPSPPAASNLLVSRPDVEEEKAGPSFSNTP